MTYLLLPCKIPDAATPMGFSGPASDWKLFACLWLSQASCFPLSALSHILSESAYSSSQCSVFPLETGSHSSSCPRTHYKVHAGLRLRELPVSALRILGLKAWVTTHLYLALFFKSKEWSSFWNFLCVWLLILDGVCVYYLDSVHVLWQSGEYNGLWREFSLH